MIAAVAEHKNTGRKPVQMELIGGKPPRQKVWEQIRKQREGFQIRSVSEAAGADYEMARAYLIALEKGGFIVRLTGKTTETANYQLLKDVGIESPRINKNGEPVSQGMAQEAMWRCLRMLGSLDARMLVKHATSSGVEVKESTARRYIGALKKAGYLQVVSPCVRKLGKLEIVKLIPRMNTGPRPPQVQRVGVVYDPNLNKVMHADAPEELL